MNHEKTWLSCREAAKILNFTQRHILNLIQKGRISAEKDPDGRYIIQKAEFYRVYPDRINVEVNGTSKKSSENEATKVLEEKLKHLQEIIDEKKKQNEFLIEQLNNFNLEKSKMLEAIVGQTRLLEHKQSSVKVDGEAKKGWFRSNK